VSSKYLGPPPFKTLLYPPLEKPRNWGKQTRPAPFVKPPPHIGPPFGD